MVPNGAEKIVRKKIASGRKNHISLSSAINLVVIEKRNSIIDRELVQTIPVQQSGQEFKLGQVVLGKTIYMTLVDRDINEKAAEVFSTNKLAQSMMEL